KIYPRGIGNLVRVRLRDGRVYEEESIYPPGHYMNPLTVEGVEEKFWKLVADKVDVEKAREFLRMAWNLENIHDIGLLMRKIIVKS
ncbi:MAG: MmgE/PrpD family protein, partial [Acidilobaceae archaeon]